MSQPLRCDVCGRFIAWRDFETYDAVRVMVTPDSIYSREEYETLCKDHVGKVQPG